MKKAEGTQPEAAGVVDAVVEAVANVENVELTTLKKSFEAQTEQLNTALSQLAEANAKLQEIADAEAKVEADAKKVKLDARLQSIVDIVGTVKAEQIVGATESLDDEAFKAVADAMQVSMDKEADSAKFKDVGVAAESPTAPVVEESLEKKKIKEKYGAGKKVAK